VEELRVGAMFRCNERPEELVPFARRVEALGYDELWLVEDCFFAGGIASAAAALAATRRIAVGLGILPAVMRNPATAAMELAALARLFPGRVLPGFGHGVAAWMRQIGALPPSPLAALGETIAAVRALLAAKTVTMDGAHVHLDAVRLEHPPAIPPPVSAGVRGPRSLELSGRVADGTVVAELSSPGYVRWARERIDAGRALAGRTDPHRLTVYALLGVGAAARRALHDEIAGALSGGAIPQLGPSESAAPDAATMAAGLPHALVERLAVVGEPRACANALRRLREAGADTVVLVPPHGPEAALRQLEEAAGQVLPTLR
jgi:alkanesulfonate monooxygenase SsuD/methylene tetrahydromethanopterin reductase-like flavin-dependent oxidoreductase (luciferase family)